MESLQKILFSAQVSDECTDKFIQPTENAIIRNAFSQLVTCSKHDLQDRSKIISLYAISREEKNLI